MGSRSACIVLLTAGNWAHRDPSGAGLGSGEKALDPVMGRRAEIKDGLPHRPRVFGRRHAGNGRGGTTEDPTVEAAWRSLNLLLPGILDRVDCAENDIKKGSNEGEPFAPLVARTRCSQIQPREGRRDHTRVQSEALGVEGLTGTAAAPRRP